MKNTGIKAPNKLSPAKLPKGSKILLIMAFKSMFNITLTNQEITIMTIAGTKDSNERATRSEEHTSELQSRFDLVCRLLLEKKKNKNITNTKHKKQQL